MVVIKDGCLKGAKGVFGDLVVYQLGGQTVVRRRGERGKQVFSEGQRAQQVRMSAVAFLWKAVRAAGVDKAWCGAMKGLPKTGYNEFVRVNVAIFRKRGCIGDFEKLQLTAGPLLLPNDLKLGRDEDGGWEMRWDSRGCHPSMNADDRIGVALMKREDVFTVKVLDIGDCRRRHGGVKIRLPPALSEFTHLFCYVCSDSGELFSGSRHFCIMPKI